MKELVFFKEQATGATKSPERRLPAIEDDQQDDEAGYREQLLKASVRLQKTPSDRRRGLQVRGDDVIDVVGRRTNASCECPVLAELSVAGR